MTKLYGTPGPRAIHPSICTSKSVGTCSMLAQLLFDRLITQADDQGRLEDGADYIRGVCIPLLSKVTAKAVEAALVELEAAKMIRRYKVPGRELIQLLGWWTYQHGMRWRYPSRFPAPDGWRDSVKMRPADGNIPPDDGQIPPDDGQLAEFDGLASASGRPRQPNRAVPDRAVPNPSVPEPSRPPEWEEPEGEAVTWLANHGCFIRPDSGYYPHLVRAVEEHGVNAVIGMFDRLARAGTKNGDVKGFLFKAVDALNPKVKVADLEREDRAEDNRRKHEAELARTRKLIAEHERLAAS